MTLPPTVPSTRTLSAPVSKSPVTLPRTVTLRPKASRSPLTLPSMAIVSPAMMSVSSIVSSGATVMSVPRRISSAWLSPGSAMTTMSSESTTAVPARLRASATAPQASSATISVAPIKFIAVDHMAVPS
jgi:hypothetical protein